MLSCLEVKVRCRSSSPSQETNSADGYVAEPSKGDSGSLVLDAQSYEAYGQLVASNPLAELYVVPLTAIIRQIKLAFNTNDVTFPNARTVVASHRLLPTEPSTPLISVNIEANTNVKHETKRSDPQFSQSSINRNNDRKTGGNADRSTAGIAWAGNDRPSLSGFAQVPVETTSQGHNVSVTRKGHTDAVSTLNSKKLRC